MEKVQINEVREKLAKYLAEAEQVEEIIILLHSKPVARLCLQRGETEISRYDNVPETVQR